MHRRFHLRRSRYPSLESRGRFNERKAASPQVKAVMNHRSPNF